jgi:hypothetical protein
MSNRGNSSSYNDNNNSQITTDIKQGPIEADYDAVALVVNYKVEKVIFFSFFLICFLLNTIIYI